MADTSPREDVLEDQRQRQVTQMRTQAEHYTFWLEEEHKLLSQVLADENFVRKGCTYEKWLQAAFEPDDYDSSVLSEERAVAEWKPAHFVATSFGIQVCGTALKLMRPVSLRAFALEVTVDFRLKGASTFWLSTRGRGFKDPAAVICRIEKDEESQRLFLEFGALTEGEKFHFFKKQELPARVNTSEDALACDYTNVHMHFLDNGDNRVFVQLSSSKNSVEKSEAKRKLQSSCNCFIPCLDPTQVTLLGSGESVEVSTVRVRYAERLLTPVRPHGSRKCCALM